MGSIAKVKGFASLIPVDATRGAAIDEHALQWNRKEAILDTTEKICQLMEEEGVSRAELARRMGKSRPFISQLLDGERNMTIGTVADVFSHLGHKLRITWREKEVDQREREREVVVRVVTMQEYRIPVEGSGAHAYSAQPTGFADDEYLASPITASSGLSRRLIPMSPIGSGVMYGG